MFIHTKTYSSFGSDCFTSNTNLCVNYWLLPSDSPSRESPQKCLSPSVRKCIPDPPNIAQTSPNKHWMMGCNNTVSISVGRSDYAPTWSRTTGVLGLQTANGFHVNGRRGLRPRLGRNPLPDLEGTSLTASLRSLFKMATAVVLHCINPGGISNWAETLAADMRPHRKPKIPSVAPTAVIDWLFPRQTVDKRKLNIHLTRVHIYQA